MEARVVPRPEEMCAPEVGEVLAERPNRGDHVLVVARAVRFEPLAIVVVLEVAKELEGLGGEAAE
jgi:hypothetical protein